MKNFFLASAALSLVLLASCGQSAPTQSTGTSEQASAITAQQTQLSRADELATGTLSAIAEAIAAGEVSSEDMVRAYQKRIEEIDRSGPTLRSVLALNPNAFEDAKAADAARANGETLGPLHGVPVLLKDNIETKDPVATTAGALVLKGNIVNRDWRDYPWQGQSLTMGKFPLQ